MGCVCVCRTVEPQRLVRHPGVQGQPDDVRDHLRGDGDTEARREGHLRPAGVESKPRHANQHVPRQEDFLCPFGKAPFMVFGPLPVYTVDAQSYVIANIWRTVTLDVVTRPLYVST